MTIGNNFEILVEVRRGAIVESTHRGHLAIVDGDGELLCALGDAGLVTFLRSAAKPFQAIAFLLSGAAERFGLTEREIALACGSHNGEPQHTAAAAAILAKIGLTEHDLHCGAHEPFNQEIARELIIKQQPPTQLHNNCSGKHAAMLAFAQCLEADIETYEALENPVQQNILSVIERFSGLSRDEIEMGVDGCAAPNFAVPIATMARMFAKLILPPRDFNHDLREACRRVVTAMIQFPEMVGGSLTERLDTEIMRQANGKIVSKIGAEGVYCAGVLPSPQYKRGLGIALKIADGSDKRARPVATLEILRQLGILDATKSDSLRQFARPILTNWRGDKVGEIMPRFELPFALKAQ